MKHQLLAGDHQRATAPRSACGNRRNGRASFIPRLAKALGGGRGSEVVEGAQRGQE